MYHDGSLAVQRAVGVVEQAAQLEGMGVPRCDASKVQPCLAHVSAVLSNFSGEPTTVCPSPSTSRHPTLTRNPADASCRGQTLFFTQLDTLYLSWTVLSAVGAAASPTLHASAVFSDGGGHFIFGDAHGRGDKLLIRGGLISKLDPLLSQRRVRFGGVGIRLENRRRMRVNGHAEVTAVDTARDSPFAVVDIVLNVEETFGNWYVTQHGRCSDCACCRDARW